MRFGSWQVHLVRGAWTMPSSQLLTFTSSSDESAYDTCVTLFSCQRGDPRYGFRSVRSALERRGLQRNEAAANSASRVASSH